MLRMIAPTECTGPNSAQMHMHTHAHHTHTDIIIITIIIIIIIIPLALMIRNHSSQYPTQVKNANGDGRSGNISNIQLGTGSTGQELIPVG